MTAPGGLLVYAVLFEALHRNSMRLCPSVEGSAPPLITHRIGIAVCQAQQAANFHKCHRCIYRGQAANWEPAELPAALSGQVEGAPPPVRLVEISRPAPVKKRLDKKLDKRSDKKRDTEPAAPVRARAAPASQ